MNIRTMKKTPACILEDNIKTDLEQWLKCVLDWYSCGAQESGFLTAQATVSFS
jgi:hypothetical protein